MTLEEEPKPATAPRRFSRVVGNLTAANASVAVVALLTSPLLARALGPDGRGDLAAVLLVLGLVPVIGDFGRSTFAATESASGVPRDRIVGSVAPFLLVTGGILALLSPLVSHLVADGRENVRWLCLVSLALSPFLLFAGLAGGLVWGREQWANYIVARLVIPVGSLFTYGVLFVTDTLTVTTAGITTLVLTVLATVPNLVVLRGAGRPERDRSLARRAQAFGIRAWLTTVALQTNARLDQLLMIRLVSPTELGLYALAASLAAVQNAFTGAVLGAVIPRVAAGDHRLGAQVFRVTTLVSATISLVSILVVPLVLPVVFGEAFEPAVAMCQILLAAAVPFAAGSVLMGLCTALGKPGYAARVQTLGLVITVPALLLFVGSAGGRGAAVISLVTYSLTAVYAGRVTRRLLAMSRRELFVPRREDLVTLRSFPLIGRVLKRR